MRLRLLGLASVLVLAGCGGGEAGAPVVSTGTTAARTTRTALELFLLDPADHKLYAVRKQVESTSAVGAAALDELAASPDSQVPRGLSLAIENGDARVTGAELSPAALAQIVYTLTQFSSVQSVNGKTRKDVEDFVPSILVEQPAPEASVTSPLDVSGNANTFEATFEYDLLGADGKVLHHDFVTASSGSGERGTFDFAIPFTVERKEAGKLVVFESSAEDGSRIHVRQIPLTLAP